MIEQKINEVFSDAESTGFGTGWWSGILSAFLGFLSFGAVLCLHFPQLLSSPGLRPHYPMRTMPLLIQCLIVGAILFGVISSILRKKKVLALTGMLFAIAGATVFCGGHGLSALAGQVPIRQFSVSGSPTFQELTGDTSRICRDWGHS
jgi:hypothetical protein